MKLLLLLSLVFFAKPVTAEVTRGDVYADKNKYRNAPRTMIPKSYFKRPFDYQVYQRKLGEILRKNPELQESRKALEHGLAFFYKNRNGGLSRCGGDEEASNKLENKDWVAITDYTLPESKPRMFFINTKDGTIVKDHVAHGKGSGANSPIPVKVGDTLNSNMTSGGFFETAQIYTSRKKGKPKSTFGGKEENALKLRGLLPSNKLAYYPRGVVFHGATYVAPPNVGNSWGCPAVQLETFEKMKNSLKGGALMYLHTVREDKLKQPEC